jgi:hypothetical protein
MRLCEFGVIDEILQAFVALGDSTQGIHGRLREIALQQKVTCFDTGTVVKGPNRPVIDVGASFEEKLAGFVLFAVQRPAKQRVSSRAADISRRGQAAIEKKLQAAIISIDDKVYAFRVVGYKSQHV